MSYKQWKWLTYALLTLACLGAATFLVGILGAMWVDVLQNDDAWRQCTDVEGQVVACASRDTVTDDILGASAMTGFGIAFVCGVLGGILHDEKVR